VPRVRIQRRGADAGTSGISSSPIERTLLTRSFDGTPASSAKETWTPREASADATTGT
jgi:hypothetical protein